MAAIIKLTSNSECEPSGKLTLAQSTCTGRRRGGGGGARMEEWGAGGGRGRGGGIIN